MAGLVFQRHCIIGIAKEKVENRLPIHHNQSTDVTIHSKGNELAVAVAKEFGVDEQDFFAAMEEYKHINCSHEGGGEEDAGKDAGKKAAEEISQFSEEVLFHCLA